MFLYFNIDLNSKFYYIILFYEVSTNYLHKISKIKTYNWSESYLEVSKTLFHLEIPYQLDKSNGLIYVI